MRALTANYEGDLVFFSVEDIATKETILDSGICSEKDGDCGSGKNIKLMQESEKSRDSLRHQINIIMITDKVGAATS